MFNIRGLRLAISYPRPNATQELGAHDVYLYVLAGRMPHIIKYFVSVFLGTTSKANTKRLRHKLPEGKAGSAINIVKINKTPFVIWVPRNGTVRTTPVSKPSTNKSTSFVTINTAHC